jgi:hypothetical protein
MPSLKELRNEAIEVLDLHSHFLRKMDQVDFHHPEAAGFILRSFGYIIQNMPEVLVREDIDDAKAALFEYYSLLTELKYNVKMNYPDTILFGQPVLSLINRYPTTFHEELKLWFEEKNGVTVTEGKQTLIDPTLK